MALSEEKKLFSRIRFLTSMARDKTRADSHPPFLSMGDDGSTNHGVWAGK